MRRALALAAAALAAAPALAASALAAPCEKPLPTRSWLVVTMQRSGSRWFVDSLISRSGGLVHSFSEKFSGGYVRACVHENATDCRCAVQSSFGMASKMAKDGASASGFKVMLDENNAVAGKARD